MAEEPQDTQDQPLDTGLPHVVTITADTPQGERVWELRDDVPSAILMRTGMLDNYTQQLNAALDAGDMEAAEVAQKRYEQMLWFIFRGIVHHTDPQADDEELRALFSAPNQFRVVMRFFTPLMQQSLRVAISGGDGPAPPATTIQPNRAERRGASKGASRKRQVMKALGG